MSIDITDPENNYQEAEDRIEDPELQQLYDEISQLRQETNFEVIVGISQKFNI